MRSCEKIRGIPIDQDLKIDSREASHNPIYSKERHSNLYQDQSDISPVNMIKSLCKIQFENKGAEILGFDRMKDLLHNTYRFGDLTVFKKPELFLWYTQIQKGL